LWDAWPINTYTSKFIQRQAVPTPVTMQVGAVLLSGNTYRIQIRTCLESTSTAKNLRTYAVVVQDHYPATPTYERNTFRTATATADFLLQPGDCHFETRDVTMDPNWTQTNLGIIAWAQTPATTGPAEVYQAAKDMWPFQALLSLGDLNCDGEANFDDIDPFVLALSSPDEYLIAFPNCNILNGDCNQDGNVDFDDIDAFVALLSG
jgi:hypothetical protein